MGSREREPVDQHWQAVYRALLNKLARRDAEYIELHEDYMALELRLNNCLAYLHRHWARQDVEIANRLAARASND